MDSCLKVGISAEGASKIIPQLGLIQLRYGTDSHAWSKMASDYWNNDNTAFDPESTCQLNYVIVISDGRMRNHGIPKEIYMITIIIIWEKPQILLLPLEKIWVLKL